jgi:hypothetical protein
MPSHPYIIHLSALTKVTTQHAGTLVAFVLEPPPDQQLSDLSNRLNDPSAHPALQSSLTDLVRALQTSASSARAATTTPQGTQYIHNTSNPPRFASNWKSHELVSVPTKEPSTSGKSRRPRREVTVDALGVCARESLISYVPFPLHDPLRISLMRDVGSTMRVSSSRGRATTYGSLVPGFLVPLAPTLRGGRRKGRRRMLLSRGKRPRSLMRNVSCAARRGICS